MLRNLRFLGLCVGLILAVAAILWLWEIVPAWYRLEKMSKNFGLTMGRITKIDESSRRADYEYTVGDFRCLCWYAIKESDASFTREGELINVTYSNEKPCEHRLGNDPIGSLTMIRTEMAGGILILVCASGLLIVV